MAVWTLEGCRDLRLNLFAGGVLVCKIRGFGAAFHAGDLVCLGVVYLGVGKRAHLDLGRSSRLHLHHGMLRLVSIEFIACITR